MSKHVVMLFVALLLGLGWAIRGHFGHEWGASWAGAIGALAVIAAVKRIDWWRKTPVLTTLGAIGWAVGGMMSYGIVIGYCRGTDFANVTYGYTMLAVIGGLYGFFGGGLFGLGLETTTEKKPDWAGLMTQMVAGGLVVWGFIIKQLEWKMTPPRSEAWAICLGAALALGWYLRREGFSRALRTAAYAALGAGFGFSFGNFLQTMGSASGFPINWWNVMEFCLGFFGGLGMAYAVITRDWPESEQPSKTANWLALIFFAVAIPLINYFANFDTAGFVQLAEQLNITGNAGFVTAQRLFGVFAIVVFSLLILLTWRRYDRRDSNITTVAVPVILFLHTCFYTDFAYIRKGFFYQSLSLKNTATWYVFIIAVCLVLWIVYRKKESIATDEPLMKESWKRWVVILSSVVIVILIFALISIHGHGEMSGAHERF